MGANDVITVGNATIDAFLSVHEESSYLKLDEAHNELRIRSGQKIPVDACELLVGGNASNVAVGLSRLGFSVGLCAEIGDDELSEKILKTLYKEKVDFRLIKRSSHQKTSFSVALNFKGERTLFVGRVERDHVFDLSQSETKWIYLTSLSTQWKRPYKDVLDFVENCGCKLAFNPGTLQVAQKGEETELVFAKADVSIVNKEEAEILVGEPLDISSLLKRLQEKGSKIVVITDGKNGSWGIDQHGKEFFQDIIKADVVERTGAGDAYATGFLGGIMQDMGVQDAMQMGARNASAVIGKVGAQTGLLTKEEMEKGLL